mmetsp:Transcript_30724/g.43007  ORF Transcript_30724/g.43007 Transcript_30724/m.43007 type:complete len:259 (-) Transcript_30724:323-1099(-)
MTRHKQVQTIGGVQAAIPPRVVAAREVSHHDLPIGFRVGQFGFHPGLLLSIKSPEPALAGIDRSRTPSRSTGGIRAVVLTTAHVVFRISARILGIHSIAVMHDDIHIKAKIRIRDMLAPIRSRHSPPVGGPSVCNLLIPSVVELTASPVVVAQDTEPWLVAQASTLVDAFKDVVELMSCCSRDLAHRSASTVNFNATPVKVVAHVQDIIGILHRRTSFEGVGHQELRLHIDFRNKAAARSAPGTSGIEALYKLLVVAE